MIVCLGTIPRIQSRGWPGPAGNLVHPHPWVPMGGVYTATLGHTSQQRVFFPDFFELRA